MTASVSAHICVAVRTACESDAHLGMVQAAGPVDDSVVVAPVQPHRAAHRPARVRLAKLEEPVEHGTVLAHVETLQLAHVLVLRGGLRARAAQRERWARWCVLGGLSHSGTTHAPGCPA